MKSKSLLSSVVVMLFVAAACRRGAKAPPPDPTIRIGPADYVIARQERITTGPTLSGSLQAETQANVRAQIAGPLLDVKVQEGERVRAGQLIARIGPGALTQQQSAQSSALAGGRNNLALAQRELARQRSLYGDGIASKSQVDIAQQQVDAARSQLAQAQTQIAATAVEAGNATVEAPISGIVSKRWVSEGDVVQVGTTLFTIIDPQTMQLEAAVAADNLGQVRVGTPIQFNVQGFDTKVFSGRIARVNPVADPTTRQIQAFAEIPNPNGVLASGLFAEGRVENLTHVGVVVPSAAIDRRMTTPAVTRVANGHIEHFFVTLGVIDDKNDRTEIATGVKPGDVLLVGAAQQTAPGTPVELPPGVTAAGDAAR